MRALIAELIPHAPQHGLFLAPQIPPDKLANAVRDYAHDVPPDQVLALYDATRMGSAKDGALFLEDRVVYENNPLSGVQEIRYEDVVRVEQKRLFLGGRRVEVDANRGRATVTHEIDFSGRPGAAEFVARFLHEAMLHVPRESTPTPLSTTPGGTDLAAVKEALTPLRDDGRLADDDFRRILETLQERG
jgi:hypothetical protein